jgi:hypothetical protein
LELNLRNRKLTRKQALREYPMYKIRLWEFLIHSNVFIDIVEGHYVPLNPAETRDIVRNLQLGLFCSLFDSNGDAINVFDMWVALHPTLKDEIVGVWKKIEPLAATVRKYRGTITFHMTNDPADFVHRWEAFWNQEFIEEFSEAQRVFLVLNKKLAEMESTAEFREEIRGVLADDPQLAQPVPDRDPSEGWSELILKLAFRELETPNYFRYRNPTT